MQRLLLNKDDTYSDYNREAFEAYMQQYFRIESRTELPGGTRFLYHAVASRGHDLKRQLSGRAVGGLSPT